MLDLQGVEQRNNEVAEKLDVLIKEAVSECLVQGMFSEPNINNMAQARINKKTEEDIKTVSFAFVNDDKLMLEEKDIYPVTVFLPFDSLLDNAEETEKMTPEAKVMVTALKALGITRMNEEDFDEVLALISDADSSMISCCHRYLFPVMSRIIEQALKLIQGSVYIFVNSEGIAFGVK